MGAGGMGGFFGGLSALSGEEVWLVDIQKGRIEALSEDGLVREERGIVKYEIFGSLPVETMRFMPQRGAYGYW